MLLNQSSVIRTKSGCNKEERLTQLRVPADYLVLESQRGTQSMSLQRALKLYLPHTSCLHPYLWLPVLLLTSNHKDKAVMRAKPAMAETRSRSADPNMTEINVLKPFFTQPQSGFHSLPCFLPILPSPLSRLLMNYEFL